MIERNREMESATGSRVSIRSSLLSRRGVLSIGAGAFGLSLSGLLRADARRETSVPPGGGARPIAPRAKSVIVLYLNGGPSQLDMWDMKPEAPREIRGTFSPIPSNVPGIQVCEHMPRMAQLANRYTIVRSMSHSESDHLRAGYWVMTGGRLTRPIDAFSSMERSDRPHFGSIVSRVRPSSGLPSFVVLPEYVSPRGPARPGQHGGFLGSRHDPYAILSDPNLPNYSPGPIRDGQTTSLPRWRSRRSLLHSFEDASRTALTNGEDYDQFRAKALDLVASGAARRAFDLSDESDRTRNRYGRHVFGQSVLVARRLVEAGVRIVQVNFVRNDDGKGGQGYDSHSSPPNPPHLSWAKKELLPPTDAAFAALIEDLVDRGLLDETLVVLMGEFGRTPKFNANGGRDHWPDCYSLVLAGGGVAGGHVYGASDPIAAKPTRDPVSPDDLLATVYHLLGVDHRAEIHDLLDRPHLTVDGEPVRGLLS